MDTARLVLCVDDDQATRVLIRDRLSDFQVLTAQSGGAALAMARRCPVDLYLVSARLPDYPADDLCRRLRRFDRKTPIVCYSAEARDGERELLLQSGAREHLVKPLDPELLKILIEASISDCWIESMAARIAEHAAVLEELKARSKAVGARSEENWREAERMRNRLLRIRAYRAFVEAGGCRANFGRIWPEMAQAFRVGER